jgi:hypothetical protein
VERQAAKLARKAREKALEFVKIAFGNEQIRDKAKILFRELTAILILKGTEHAKQEFTQALDRGFRGGSRTDMSLGSPLEQRFGLISQMYEHLLVTYENFTDYVWEEIAYLKKVYGDNLTNEMVKQYFALHPFLDSEEYQYQLNRMQIEYLDRFGEEEPNTSEYHASSQPIDLRSAWY